MITIELFNQPVVVPFSLNETLQLVLLAVRDAQSACQNRMVFIFSIFYALTDTVLSTTLQKNLQ